MTTCPYCSYEATEHETLNKDTNTRDGDISFCINCGEVSQFSNSSYRGLVKVDVNSFDLETQKEIKDLEIAWLKTRQQSKFAEHKETEQ